MPRAESLAAEYRVAKNVQFTESVPPRELPDYFRLADVFVMPSTGEGFGIVFLEAAASGLPLVGGNGDGSVDALADGTIGTLVDPLKQANLVEAICGALSGKIKYETSYTRFSALNFNSQVDELVRSLR